MASLPLSTDLAGRRLMIGTPMYEGMCHGAYAAMLVELGLKLRERGVPFRLSFIVNQASADRARCLIVDEFMRSDCTHLCFIDADVVARADDVLTMLAWQADDTPYDVIAGSYPRKSIDWQGVSAAAGAGVDAGRLAAFGGDMPVYLGGAAERTIRLDQPVEAETIAAGYSMVRRATFLRMMEACPELAFEPDQRERAAHGLGEVAYAFYGPRIDPVTRRFRSEDFAFCDRVRSAGLRLWLCPTMHADHIGNHRYSGTFVDTARLLSGQPLAPQANKDDHALPTAS
ncbi:hypothetical protein ACFO0A_06880 [Novosphingobium tardum]|uniref:Glycosyl transferase family 2 n=1 Tax=Novosphingobium tardum TaxID=1538021 RepID=A0ABV8RPN1_9SPHN